MPSLFELEKKGDAESVKKIYMSSKNEAVRGRALEVLGEIGGEDAIEFLIDIVLNEDSEVLKSAAAGTIAWADEKSLRTFLEKIEGIKIKKATWILVDHLIEILKNEDSSLRMNAAIALGRLGDKRAAKHLIRVLSDPSPKVRRAAAISLGMLGDNEAVEPLIERLEDENADVIIASLEALSDLKVSSQYTDRISKCLKNPNSRIRELAVSVLEKCGEKALEPLLETLKDEVREVRVSAMNSLIMNLSSIPTEKSESVRKRVSEKLTNSPGIAEVVIDLLKKTASKSVKRNAIWILGQLKDPKSVDTLVDILQNGNFEEKRLAATTLARIPESAKKLIELNHEDEEVRRLVCWILGEIKSEDTRIFLERMLEDESDSVRMMAFQAINKIEKFKR
ncbi:MAG TPA: HEAT repeat domain-containing protein [Archaeoglobaceae archaeon]|nr:HEAT repeat domain-containing protein [Archaeoglobaceae archaeon]